MALPKAYWFAFWGSNLTALIVAFVPLFNLVGYESAALFGGILGVLATGLTVHEVRRKAVAPPLATYRQVRPIDDFAILAIRHLALAVGPLLILSANALRVPNCDWAAGLAFWALIVGPAILLGQGAAWLATALLGERPWLPWLVAFSLPLLDGAALAYHLMMEPPIVGHQWFIGYFGGSIYDEALAVPTSLVAYRLLHVLAVVAVVACLGAVWELRRRRVAPWLVGIGLGATLLFGIGYSQRVHWGIAIDGETIAEELGGRVETEHFVIFYPDSEPTLDRLEELKEDHEFQYHELREFFGTDPVAARGKKIRSFVYADRDSKGALMGGRNTMVAKLWLHEMHILWGGPDDSLLVHEMAHIFTEPFGRGPLRLSMQGLVGVNMGLVEGVAAAAQWPSRELTPHEATAAMRQLELAPDLRSILGAGGFWTEVSGRAYTAMGSFVRYLIDEEGIAAFRKAYGSGDFEAAYGQDVASLIGQWERYLDDLELTARQMAVAQYRYDRTSIFGRPCARALAERRRRARQAAARGAWGRAAEHYEQCIEDSDSDPVLVRDYAAVVAELGDLEGAMQILNAFRQEQELAAVHRAQYLELLGDLKWRKGDHQAAARSYRQALDAGVPLDQERSLVLKERMAAQGHFQARQVLIERIDRGTRVYHMTQWRAQTPEDPVAAYLLGRRLWQQQEYAQALPHLEAAQSRGLSADALDGELASMLGQSYYFTGRFAAAAAIWSELARSPVTRYREMAQRWHNRLAWAARE